MNRTFACLVALPALSLAAPALAQHDMASMPGMDHSVPAAPVHDMADMAGHDAAPDNIGDMGLIMGRTGGWTTMVHALFNGVYDRQTGPRGGDKTFAAGMLMGMASRPLAQGTLTLTGMISPDPLMGRHGYPLLLSAGESADGVTPLVDRQHPHDLVMEMSAAWTRPLGAGYTLNLYGGLPGAPAFGPPAFMHRLSSLDSPEAPIGHHWFDSTHITFGVLTAGLAKGPWTLETSAFRGREPDQKRYDIETGRLDSVAARLSYQVSDHWRVQASAVRINSPEALEADHDEKRLSVSAAYSGRATDLTFGFARKDRLPGPKLDAWLAEGEWRPARLWTVFARAEQIDADELTAAHGAVYTVRKASVGVIRDFELSPTVRLGIGGLASAIDDGGAPGYGDAGGRMAFIRLKIGQPMRFRPAT
jgi:hypothetical protein